MNPIRPMLASEAELSKLVFPVLVSPKFDGVRAIVQGGVMYSRNGKPIPNQYTQFLFKHLEHYDGELIVGDPTSPSAFRDTMSGVMTQDGTPNVTLHTFDHIGNVHERFFDRLKSLKADPRVQLVPQFMVNTHSHLEQVEQSFLSEGYEGVIIRSPDAPYKMGRSTVREGGMLKLKRFMDAEAVVIGFQERMHNANELTQDELGYAKRSTYQENMRGRGDLGALLVRQDDMEFSIGTGFDDFQRKVIWANRNHYLGQLVKYKYFPTGSKNLPRFPVFLGFRDRRDI